MAVTLDEMREADGGNFSEKMDARGITDEKLIEILKEEIEAKETKTFQYQGKVFDSDEKVAHEIRLRAVDMALKLKSKYPSEKHYVTVEELPARPLTDDERLEFMGKLLDGYCKYCGCVDPDNRCQCWNDE